MDKLPLEYGGVAEETAQMFRDSFPGQEVEINWLREAFNIERIPEDCWDAFKHDVLERVRSHRERNLHCGAGWYSTLDGDPMRCYRILKNGQVARSWRSYQNPPGFEYAVAELPGWDPQKAVTDPPTNTQWVKCKRPDWDE
jgi:hypothetical protein